MKKFSELTKIAKTESSTGMERDPDAERREDLKQLGHTTKKWVHWTFRALAIVGLAVFLPLLVFVIGPVAFMELEYGSRWIPLQRWAISFLLTARTAGIALLTIIVTDLLRRAFNLYKKSIYSDEK